jgi:hypothetical protein
VCSTARRGGYEKFRSPLRANKNKFEKSISTFFVVDELYCTYYVGYIILLSKHFSSDTEDLSPATLVILLTDLLFRDEFSIFIFIYFSKSHFDQKKEISRRSCVSHPILLLSICFYFFRWQQHSRGEGREREKNYPGITEFHGWQR